MANNTTNERTITTRIYQDKTIKKYVCETCKYGTDRKSSFDRHLISKKHCRNVQDQGGESITTTTNATIKDVIIDEPEIVTNTTINVGYRYEPELIEQGLIKELEDPVVIFNYFRDKFADPDYRRDHSEDFMEEFLSGVINRVLTNATVPYIKSVIEE